MNKYLTYLKQNPGTTVVLGSALLLTIVYLLQEKSIENKIRDKYKRYKQLPDGDLRQTMEYMADQDDRDGMTYEYIAFRTAILELKRNGEIPIDRSYSHEDYKDS